MLGLLSSEPDRRRGRWGSGARSHLGRRRPHRRRDWGRPRTGTTGSPRHRGSPLRGTRRGTSPRLLRSTSRSPLPARRSARPSSAAPPIPPRTRRVVALPSPGAARPRAEQKEDDSERATAKPAHQIRARRKAHGVAPRGRAIARRLGGNDEMRRFSHGGMAASARFRDKKRRAPPRELGRGSSRETTEV
jgi:hypothetical protein